MPVHEVKIASMRISFPIRQPCLQKVAKIRGLLCPPTNPVLASYSKKYTKLSVEKCLATCNAGLEAFTALINTALIH